MLYSRVYEDGILKAFISMRMLWRTLTSINTSKTKKMEVHNSWLQQFKRHNWYFIEIRVQLENFKIRIHGVWWFSNLKRLQSVLFNHARNLFQSKHQVDRHWTVSDVQAQGNNECRSASLFTRTQHVQITILHWQRKFSTAADIHYLLTMMLPEINLKCPTHDVHKERVIYDNYRSH